MTLVSSLVICVALFGVATGNTRNLYNVNISGMRVTVPYNVLGGTLSLNQSISLSATDLKK